MNICFPLQRKIYLHSKDTHKRVENIQVNWKSLNSQWTCANLPILEACNYLYRDVWGKKVIRQIFSGNHTDIILKGMKETEFSNSDHTSIDVFRLAKTIFACQWVLKPRTNGRTRTHCPFYLFTCNQKTWVIY